MRTAHALTRALCAALFATLLALRLLTPVGFMPAFDRGSVTIVACPDADPAPASAMAAHHHGGHSKSLHQPCPYVPASGLGALAADFAPVACVLILAAVLLLGRNFSYVELRWAHERPPSRGPPLPV